MRMVLPLVGAEIGAYFGGNKGSKIGYATCYTGGNAVDPLAVNSPRIKSMKSARFVVFQDKKKQWRWRLLAANNHQIAQGEAHTRERDAWRAVKTLRKTMRRMEGGVVHTSTAIKMDPHRLPSEKFALGQYRGL